MSRLPSATPEAVARVARKLGFVLDRQRGDRQRGSHAVYLRAEDGKRVVIPMHKGDLKRGTLRGLITDLGIEVGRFRELL